MNIQFGTGVLYGNPVLGNQPTNPTPYRLGALQEAMVDFKGDLKKLFGQLQFPLATARGKVEVTVKGKLAIMEMQAFNQLFFAQTQSAGYNLQVDQELHTVAAGAATVSNIPIVEDWGVQYQNGQQFIKVASAPAIGQYSGPNLITGVYTFNTNDNTNVVAISYNYLVAASGVNITLAGKLMGYAPELRMILFNRFRNKYMAIELNDVTLGAISIPTKLEDFWVADFDGSANLDTNSNLGTLYSDLV